MCPFTKDLLAEEVAVPSGRALSYSWGKSNNINTSAIEINV